MYRLEEWGMGTKRSYSEYLKMVGIDMNNKVYIVIYTMMYTIICILYTMLYITYYTIYYDIYTI